jgi:propanol-preferring alcohol dehydrogenase
MMIVGIPQKGVTLNALDVALGKYRVKGASNSVPQNMGPCIEFSAEKGIRPHVSFHKLEQINEMIETMHAGKARGRLAVKFE